MALIETTPDPITGRRRFRGLITDGKSVAASRDKAPDIVVRVQVQPPALAPKRIAVRDGDLDAPKPNLTGPAEAFWPTEDYDLLPEGRDLVVYETTPSGEKREVKRYPAAKFGSERVGKNHVVRRIGQSMADRMAKGEQLRQQRLRDQARLEGMNRASRDRWAKARGGAE